MPFADVCEAAYHARVPLFAQGFYRTPGIHFDPATGQGHPFYYFTYGAAVSEVEVDGFTGAHRLRRVDILQDVGDTISPIVDRGQIEGGFIQGAGWLTVEDLLWDAEGRARHGQRVHVQAAVVVARFPTRSRWRSCRARHNPAWCRAARLSVSRR